MCVWQLTVLTSFPPFSPATVAARRPAGWTRQNSELVYSLALRSWGLQQQECGSVQVTRMLAVQRSPVSESHPQYASSAAWRHASMDALSMHVAEPIAEQGLPTACHCLVLSPGLSSHLGSDWHTQV